MTEKRGSRLKNSHAFESHHPRNWRNRSSKRIDTNNESGDSWTAPRWIKFLVILGVANTLAASALGTVLPLTSLPLTSLPLTSLPLTSLALFSWCRFTILRVSKSMLKALLWYRQVTPSRPWTIIKYA